MWYGAGFNVIGREMSDYATCVTEPFWKSHLPDAYAYFVSDEWTEVTGDRGAVSFCKVFRDLSVGGIHAQVIGALIDVEKLVKPDVDLHLCLIEDGGKIESFSLSDIREDRAALREYFQRKEEHDRAVHDRVARDIAADNGVPNLELEQFLDTSPKPTLTVETWSEAVSEAWRLRQGSN